MSSCAENNSFSLRLGKHLANLVVNGVHLDLTLGDVVVISRIENQLF